MKNKKKAPIQIEEKKEPTAAAPKTNETDVAGSKEAGSSDDEDVYSDGEEVGQLVFDTKIGKLVRPTPPNARTLSNPKLKEGQSEEEDGYQAFSTDEKVPSEPRHSSSVTSADLRVRQKLL